MALAPGTRLGPYEIQSALGAGGMGEVYRARDTRLQRDVAIKVRPDGTVKVLDFGLAKALDTAPEIDLSQASTITSPAMTRIGVIMGTAAYMSPEQAKGKPLDKRTDIWAFGCVLYELLTGKRAFGGADVGDTLAFIITKEPDWAALPRTLPPAIGRLLRRCLEKDHKRRLADIADARLEIDERDLAPDEFSSPPRTRRFSTLIVGLVAATLAFGLGSLGSRSSLPIVPYRAALLPPANATLLIAGLPGAGRFALSPDGRRLAFVARGWRLRGP